MIGIENGKEIEELPDYIITSTGDVYRISTGMFRKWVPYDGYLTMIVVVNGVRITIKQHQVVMRFHNPDYKLFQGYKYVIDHINSNRSDNRIENLRVVSQRDNVAKELLHKRKLPTGVWLHKLTGKFSCEIHFGDTKYYLGLFFDVKSAKEAYDLALSNYESKNILPVPRRSLTKTSKHKHISLRKKSGLWIYVNNKRRIAKLFKTENEAVEFKLKVEI